MKRLRNRQLRVSRVLLVLLGLVLIAIGATGLLLSTESVDRLADPLVPGTPVWNDAGQQLVRDHQLAWQVGVLTVAVLLILVGVSWLQQQIPPIRHHDDLDLPDAAATVPDSGTSNRSALFSGTPLFSDDPVRDGSPVRGTSTLAGGAAAAAFEEDLVSSRHVDRARAEFHDRGPLRIRLDVADDVAVDEVLDEVVAPAVDRLVRVCGLESRPELVIDLRPVEPPGRIVA